VSAQLSSCRSCGASIIWARTVAGKLIPLDAETTTLPAGHFRLETRFNPPTAVSVLPGPVYASHFATCPQADEWRKESRAREPEVAQAARESGR
jgi:hypothetical protein